MKNIAMIWLAFFLVVGLLMVGLLGNTASDTGGTQAQTPEAPRSLPATGQCATNDLNMVACSAPDAVMTMDDVKSKMKTVCNSLDDRKISDMSPKELRIQGACREIADRHLWD
jgi:hypothetical protein